MHAQALNLTPVSFVVLGLLDELGEATPYQLKREASTTVGLIWTLAHSQLYKEPERLAAWGFVKERREPGGRRRRFFKLTAAGRKVLKEWIATPTPEAVALRHPGLLKIHFGADPAELAPFQLDAHRQQLELLESLAAAHESGSSSQGHVLCTDHRLAYAREDVRFWSRLARS